MIRLVCNKAERKQFGENAYKRYEEEFSLDKMAVRYVDYYKKL